MVYEAPNPMEGSINLLRLYCGFERYTEARWYEGGPKREGKFVYFVRGREIPGVRPWGTAFGRDYYFIDQMPPPEPFRADRSP